MNINNVFEKIKFPNLEPYHCDLWSYQVGHSELVLRLTHVDQPFDENAESIFLIFTNVAYFSGPTKWRGADFSQGSKAQCASILDKTNFENADMLAERIYTLFVKKLPDIDIKIIASDVIERESVIKPRIVFSTP